MAEPLNLIACSIFINSAGIGGSEKYWLKPSITSLATAIAKGEQIARRRRACLAEGDEIVWCRVAHADKKHRSRSCIEGVLTGYPKPGSGDDLNRDKVNKFVDSLLVRFETDDGRFGERHFRSIPDPDIFDELFVPDAPVFDGDPAGSAPLDGTSDWVDAFIDFVRYIRDNTVCAHRTQYDPPDFDTADWVSAKYRRTGTRKSGDVFGHVPGIRSAA